MKNGYFKRPYVYEDLCTTSVNAALYLNMLMSLMIMIYTTKQAHIAETTLNQHWFNFIAWNQRWFNVKSVWSIGKMCHASMSNNDRLRFTYYIVSHNCSSCLHYKFYQYYIRFCPFSFLSVSHSLSLSVLMSCAYAYKGNVHLHLGHKISSKADTFI